MLFQGGQTDLNSLNEIWQSVMDLISGELTQTAVKTWFSDCTPVEISNNVLVIHTTSDFKPRCMSCSPRRLS